MKMMSILQKTVFMLMLCSSSMLIYANNIDTDEFTALVKTFNYTSPTVKHTVTGDKICRAGKTPVLAFPETFTKQYLASINSLLATHWEFAQITGNNLNISLRQGIDPNVVPQLDKQHLEQAGAYTLSIQCPNIIISANTSEGFINGLTTLESMIASRRGYLPATIIADYPTTKIRALHLALWPAPVNNIKLAIKRARFGHFNTLILQLHRGVKLKSLQHIAMKDAMSAQEFRDIVQFAKENGLEVIPELKLLSHQEKFLDKKYPEYLFNQLTYDPRQKQLYTDIVFPAIDEVLSITGAQKMHIGHDEVAGWNDWFFKTGKLKPGEKQLPPELFLQDVLTLHQYLSRKKIEVWMWGDMLVTKEEFPVLQNAGPSLNGHNGYNKLRSKLPKDIVIILWHYSGKQTEYPSALAVAQEGHRVLGASWLGQTTRSFTRYINKMPTNNAGMVATTWFGLAKQDKIKKIHDGITYSAEVFWNEQ